MFVVGYWGRCGLGDVVVVKVVVVKAVVEKVVVVKAVVERVAVVKAVVERVVDRCLWGCWRLWRRWLWLALWRRWLWWLKCGWSKITTAKE